MRITEGQLRRIIRDELLREGMITPEEAVEERILFVIRKSDDRVQIDALADGKWRVGEIMALPVEGIACSGAWFVRLVETSRRGLGPLLYDLMMDVVSPHPLTSDRETVSKYALKVWKYYLNNRSDVESTQLDDPENTLTPVDDDNCYQDSAKEWSKSRWHKSPLARAFRRIDGRTPTLDALQELGAIKFR